MEKIKVFCKKQIVFVVALLAALISLLVSHPTAERFLSLDWRTLFTLFMLLLVLEGFKKEKMFYPFFCLTDRFKTIKGLSYFLVGVVFFLAPFITNDVSLVTFVPLTIIIFKGINKEKYLLPIVILENIAAITGAFLTPFGNPQNLFIYTNTEVSSMSFILHMLPMWIVGLVGLFLAVNFVFRKNPKEPIYTNDRIEHEAPDPQSRGLRVFYLALLVLLLVEIVTRMFNFVDIVMIVLVALLIFDRKVFGKVDYYLLSTFFLFFLFSSSIADIPFVKEFLSTHVGGNEYWWGLGISQIISNVPGAALLLQFSENYTALLYGVNAAGMGTIVGSLASLITFSIYNKEYPKEKKNFFKYFHVFSLCFLVLLILTALPILNWAL
ncbi:MAG: SLC13 family permease [Candidatus Ornithospirochaeta sp.]